MVRGDGFSELLRTIDRLLNIQTTNYKEDYIKRRLASRMRMTKNEKYGDYQKYLLSHPDEHESLRNTLTINVTEFFRDSSVFEAIKREVFPKVMRTKNTIRVWSAACATGEEPYSLAMLIHELKSVNKDLNATIFATDIDPQALAKAKQGIYEGKSLKNIDEKRLRRHFTDLGDGRYEVKQHLRDLIKFQRHDLMTGVPVSRVTDVITCRNVTIYFTEKQKSDLAIMFNEALVKGGFYVMGKAEYLPRDVENLFVAVNRQERIFVKKGPCRNPLRK